MSDEIGHTQSQSIGRIQKFFLIRQLNSHDINDLTKLDFWLRGHDTRSRIGRKNCPLDLIEVGQKKKNPDSPTHFPNFSRIRGTGVRGAHLIVTPVRLAGDHRSAAKRQEGQEGALQRLGEHVRGGEEVK